MPIKTIKWRCKWKCGHRAIQDWHWMERHERMCWYNPENRTCKTCENEIYYNGESEGWVRECKDKRGDVLVDEMWNSLDNKLDQKYQQDKKDEWVMGEAQRWQVGDNQIPPITNCEYFILSQNLEKVVDKP